MPYHIIYDYELREYSVFKTLSPFFFSSSSSSAKVLSSITTGNRRYGNFLLIFNDENYISISSTLFGKLKNKIPTKLWTVVGLSEKNRKSKH